MMYAAFPLRRLNEIFETVPCFIVNIICNNKECISGRYAAGSSNVIVYIHDLHWMAAVKWGGGQEPLTELYTKLVDVPWNSPAWHPILWVDECGVYPVNAVYIRWMRCISGECGVYPVNAVYIRWMRCIWWMWCISGECGGFDEWRACTSTSVNAANQSIVQCCMCCTSGLQTNTAHTCSQPVQPGNAAHKCNTWKPQKKTKKRCRSDRSCMCRAPVLHSPTAPHCKTSARHTNVMSIMNWGWKLLAHHIYEQASARYHLKEFNHAAKIIFSW